MALLRSNLEFYPTSSICYAAALSQMLRCKYILIPTKQAPYHSHGNSWSFVIHLDGKPDLLLVGAGVTHLSNSILDDEQDQKTCGGARVARDHSDVSQQRRVLVVGTFGDDSWRSATICRVQEKRERYGLDQNKLATI